MAHTKQTKRGGSQRTGIQRPHMRNASKMPTPEKYEHHLNDHMKHFRRRLINAPNTDVITPLIYGCFKTMHTHNKVLDRADAEGVVPAVPDVTCQNFCMYDIPNMTLPKMSPKDWQSYQQL